MSKLAAVRTGQPTPVAPNHQHPSPLQAQRAEAEASGALIIDDLEAPDPVVVNPRSAHSAAAATVTAAWLSLEAKELEVRNYFRKLDVSSGLEMLARMRKQCDLAAETLQQRMDDGNKERCTGCGKTLEEVRKTQWIMIGSDMDPDTGVPVPYRFCGPICVRERNRRTMLPKDQRDKLRFDGQEEGEIR